MAHIGVIRCLEDHGFNIRYVAGSSIGSIVGGVYAAGKLDAFTDWAVALRKRDVYRLLDFSFGDGALFKGDRIIEVLRELIGERVIEELDIGYTAVAADIAFGGKGKEVWFTEGSLFDAMRASMAVPSFFSPLIQNGQILVDGGVINPVPVAPTLNDRTALTFAVSLNGAYDPALDPREEPEESQPSDNPIVIAYQKSIGQFIENLWPEDAKPDEELGQELGLTDVMVRSMEVMQAALTQFKLAATAPSYMLEMPVNLCSFLDFHRAEALIDYGYQRTEALLRYHNIEPVEPPAAEPVETATT